MEPSGGLLEARGVILDGWFAVLEAVELIREMAGFLVSEEGRCLLWSLWSVVEDRVGG